MIRNEHIKIDCNTGQPKNKIAPPLYSLGPMMSFVFVLLCSVAAAVFNLLNNFLSHTKHKLARNRNWSLLLSFVF